MGHEQQHHFDGENEHKPLFLISISAVKLSKLIEYQPPSLQIKLHKKLNDQNVGNSNGLQDVEFVLQTSVAITLSHIQTQPM